MYTAFYLNEVREDILTATQWYAEQREGLDVLFVAAVKEAIANIVKMPSAYAVRYKNIRIAHTKIFPYNIHFFIDEANRQVVVTGVTHNRRQDALLLER
ncbi:MAG: hypothetical protein LBT94_01460 [Prevotellaceae bacterium]|jgi:mRNA-degrading endonuclease RelE of RelBE toxin-antitoxin system|nr:hypothetical protein [Prevotellaceae bacterium]